MADDGASVDSIDYLVLSLGVDRCTVNFGPCVTSPVWSVLTGALVEAEASIGNLSQRNSIPDTLNYLDGKDTRYLIQTRSFINISSYEGQISYDTRYLPKSVARPVVRRSLVRIGQRLGLYF